VVFWLITWGNTVERMPKLKDWVSYGKRIWNQFPSVFFFCWLMSTFETELRNVVIRKS